MSHLESKRPPLSEGRAHNSNSNHLERDDNTTSGLPLQMLRAAWLRRRGVGEPLATLAASIAFIDREAR